VRISPGCAGRNEVYTRTFYDEEVREQADEHREEDQKMEPVILPPVTVKRDDEDQNADHDLEGVDHARRGII